MRLMTKTLVAYYSWTGHTATVAEAIAAELSADVERIRDARPRSGGKGNLRSVFEALFKRAPAILPAETDASDYDLVILGCPVWAQRMASPMRAYIRRDGGRIRRLAVFCTQGGVGGDRVNRAMAELCGQSAIAELAVAENKLATGAYAAQVAAFVQAVRTDSAQAGAGAA